MTLDRYISSNASYSPKKSSNSQATLIQYFLFENLVSGKNSSYKKKKITNRIVNVEFSKKFFIRLTNFKRNCDKKFVTISADLKYKILFELK